MSEIWVTVLDRAHELAAYHAMGFSPEEVAEMFKLPVNLVEGVLSNPGVQWTQ